MNILHKISHLGLEYAWNLIVSQSGLGWKPKGCGFLQPYYEGLPGEAPGPEAAL